MLKHLLIENYALIEKLDTDFSDGLTVITGETGAGKSILLGALSLILGQRADTGVLNDKSGKCIIEGTFELSEIPIKPLFDTYDLDYDDHSIFRREITPGGKSRAFINDTPVNLQAMRSITEHLIDIHSQHESLLVGTSSFQFDVVDSYAHNLDRVEQYQRLFKKYRQKQQELQELREKEHSAKTQLDYFQYQYEELEKAAPDAGEFQQMESEMTIIKHAEEIKYALEKATYLFKNAEVNVLDALHEIIALLKPLEQFGDNYRELAARIESLAIEAKDIAEETEHQQDEVSYNPEHASKMEARLDSINKLLMKHNVNDVNELIQIKESYRQKINETTSLENRIEDLSKEVDEMADSLKVQASEISSVRESAIPHIKQEVLSLLKDLGMPGAQFDIRQEHLESLSQNGIDHLTFMFNANVGGEMKPLSKIASGGELSRFMLSIKSMISQKKLLPTIIFDEIDTGISGETSTKVANILDRMSNNMQVITITHLPQIASRGQTHMLVYKSIVDDMTQTHVQLLNEQARIAETAKMLGGEKPSKVMEETAKELIFNKQK